LKEAITYLGIILLLVSCNIDKQSASGEMPPLYPAPQTVAVLQQKIYKLILDTTSDPNGFNWNKFKKILKNGTSGE